MMSELAGLLARAIVSEQEDRPAWLAARAVGVTATEMKKLMMGGPGTVATLVREKIEGDFPDLAHVPRIAWGRAREEFIAAWIEGKFGITASAHLFYSEAHARFMATPDGIGEDFDGCLVNSEIKTGKYGLDPEDPTSYFWESGYYYQVQWALFVTGASKCLFAWEQHDDDFSGWPNTGPAIPLGEPEFRWIVRDEVLISEMIDRAKAFLEALDDAMNEVQPDADPQLVLLSAELLAARRAEAEAKARKDAVWKRLLARLESEPEMSKPAGSATVTWTPGRIVPTIVPDPVAAAAAHPMVYRAVSRAIALWEHVVSKYTKPLDTTVPGRLTVTPAKKGK